VLKVCQLGGIGLHEPWHRDGFLKLEAEYAREPAVVNDEEVSVINNL
jgi:hypothetical protein